MPDDCTRQRGPPVVKGLKAVGFINGLHQANWPAVKMALPGWFEHPGKGFLIKKQRVESFTHLWRLQSLWLKTFMKPSRFVSYDVLLQ